MRAVLTILALCLSLMPARPGRSFVHGKPCPDRYAECLAIIKEFEGLRLEPYELFGDWYIGHGHLIKKGERFGRISTEQADSLLRKDFDAGLKYVPDSLTGGKRLVAGMYAYNCGVGRMLKAFKNPMTEKRYLSTCHVNGKVHKKMRLRRIREFKLFTN